MLFIDFSVLHNYSRDSACCEPEVAKCRTPASHGYQRPYL